MVRIVQNNTNSTGLKQVLKRTLKQVWNVLHICSFKVQHFLAKCLIFASLDCIQFCFNVYLSITTTKIWIFLFISSTLLYSVIEFVFKNVDFHYPDHHFRTLYLQVYQKTSSFSSRTSKIANSGKFTVPFSIPDERNLKRYLKIPSIKRVWIH